MLSVHFKISSITFWYLPLLTLWFCIWLSWVVLYLVTVWTDSLDQSLSKYRWLVLHGMLWVWISDWLPLTLQPDACWRLPGLALSEVVLLFFYVRLSKWAFSPVVEVFCTSDTQTELTLVVAWLAWRSLLWVCCVAQCQKGQQHRTTSTGTSERNLFLLICFCLFFWTSVCTSWWATKEMFLFHSFSFLQFLQLYSSD